MEFLHNHLFLCGELGCREKQTNKHYLLYALYINICIHTIYYLLCVLLMKCMLYIPFIPYITFNPRMNSWCRYYDSIFYQWGNEAKKVRQLVWGPTTTKWEKVGFLSSDFFLYNSELLSWRNRCHSAQLGGGFASFYNTFDQERHDRGVQIEW